MIKQFPDAAGLQQSREASSVTGSATRTLPSSQRQITTQIGPVSGTSRCTKRIKATNCTAAYRRGGFYGLKKLRALPILDTRAMQRRTKPRAQKLSLLSPKVHVREHTGMLVDAQIRIWQRSVFQQTSLGYDTMYNYSFSRLL